MRVLLTGATGFIGRHIAARLIAGGHDVVCCVRNETRAARMFPGQRTITCDFNRDTRPEAWSPRLAEVDAVVNCVGILQASRGQSIDAIHTAAPKALYEACREIGVRRVIQISALGTDEGAGTAYAKTKRAADAHLQSLDLDWTILKPSLVYSCAGSYGGTSLFRAMAALPFAVPVVGDGTQTFQPIHMDDLAKGVLRLLEVPHPPRRVIAASGPQALSLAEILIALRRWLGMAPVPILRVPPALVDLIARLAERLGAPGPVNTTALRMLTYGNAADPDDFIAATGIEPRRFAPALSAQPAHVQDRWHARMYFLRPLLRLVIGLFWIASGLVALTPGAIERAAPLLREAGVPDDRFGLALAAGALIDIVLGSLLLIRWRVLLVGCLQLLVTAVYLIWLTIADPGLWMNPLGALTKVLPLVVATLVMMAIEEER